MIVSNNVSPLWLNPPANYRSRLAETIGKGLDDAPEGKATVFFRADDVGVPGYSFSAMAEAFKNGQAPLGMAVVPAWLTTSRWEALRKVASGNELFCWCQHGWRHMNFEAPGAKKREFGQARPARDKRQDLAKGFGRLRDILQKDFTPVFVPPWNRCDGESLAAMPGIGFKGISRTVGAGPETPGGLPDFPILMDIHTRKETDPVASLDAMLEELHTGLVSGQCGIMLHHQRMNQASLDFLKLLIKELGAHPKVDFAHFGHLIG